VYASHATSTRHSQPSTPRPHNQRARGSQPRARESKRSPPRVRARVAAARARHLVDEDGRGRVAARHLEEELDHALSVAAVLGGERRARHAGRAWVRTRGGRVQRRVRGRARPRAQTRARHTLDTAARAHAARACPAARAPEEGGLALRRHRLCEQRLARARRPKHEDALPRPPDALEVVRHQQREDHGLLQQALRLRQAGHVRPGHPASSGWRRGRGRMDGPDGRMDGWAGADGGGRGWMGADGWVRERVSSGRQARIRPGARPQPGHIAGLTAERVRPCVTHGDDVQA
jgi:hypothetical protein